MRKRNRTIAVLTIAGSYISYTVGVGFASGNEILQFFGSWGISGGVQAVLGAFFVTFISCVCLYCIGSRKVFETTTEIYDYIGGRYLGRFFRGFTLISVFGAFMLMFSGAGSMLQQVWGLPTWIGAVALGFLSGAVVLGGLGAVEKALGSVGLILLAYVVVFGVISLFHPNSDIGQAMLIPQAVASGAVEQANLFALPPLSFLPGLAERNGPFLEGALYAALCVVNGVPFFLTLGKKVDGNGQAIFAALVTSVAFYACVAFLLLLMMLNFEAVIDPITKEMQPFPALAAVDAIWPSGSWIYVFMFFGGIFTTTVGFLWVLLEWFFPERKERKKPKAFVVGMILFGILFGSVLPFSRLINIIFPLSGLVGLVILFCLLVRVKN